MAAEQDSGKEIGEIGEKKKPNILLIVVGALMLVVVLGVVYLVGANMGLFHGAQHNKPEGTEVVERAKPVVEDVLALEPFMANLADPLEVRYVRATFELGLRERPKTEPERKDITIIRDTILSLLGSKTSDEISTNDGKENLREEIRMLINDRSTLKVSEVYITEFIVQF